MEESWMRSGRCIAIQVCWVKFTDRHYFGEEIRRFWIPVHLVHLEIYNWQMICWMMQRRSVICITTISRHFRSMRLWGSEEQEIEKSDMEGWLKKHWSLYCHQKANSLMQSDLFQIVWVVEDLQVWDLFAQAHSAWWMRESQFASQ